MRFSFMLSNHNANMLEKRHHGELFKTKLVKQQKHPNFVCSQKKNVSFPLEPLLNLQNLAHVSHKYHMSLKQQGHPMGFQRPVERSPSFLMTQSESTRHTNDS